MAGVATETIRDQEKLILFRVSGETFALPILQAREVVSGFSVTRVPTLPRAYCGVVSVRGAAIPVVDLRERLFHEPTRQDDHDARVIVLDLAPSPVGLLVEAVQRVSAQPRERQTAVPETAGAAPSHAIRAMVETAQGKFVILLDAPELVRELRRDAMNEGPLAPARSAEAAGDADPALWADEDPGGDPQSPIDICIQLAQGARDEDAADRRAPGTGSRIAREEVTP